ncbi:MAG TPA: S41 family peptidase [Terriglobales bacterium]|nr:S41 family peptidase [Terriglobales bacterium]
MRPKHYAPLSLVLVFVLQCILAAQTTASLSATFDRQPWLDDFHQLLSEMSSHYANLDWAVEERRMDLPHLREQTEDKLRAAKDDSEARRALEQFLSSFGDGHLEIRWPKPQATNSTSDKHGSLCDTLGYSAKLSPGLDFSLLPSFTPVTGDDSNLFPGGLLRLRDGRVLGIIRIGLFSATAYPEVCAQAIHQLGLAEGAACNADCSNNIEVATANLLTAAVERQADALRKAGATAIAVDTTHNGGGSDWMEAVPRELSSIPLHDSRFGFIRHEHWTKELRERLQDVESDLQKGRAPKVVLEQAAFTLQKAIEESRKPCDRAGVWQTNKIACSLLVSNLLYTSGNLPYAKPGSFSSLESKTSLFRPLGYQYTENTDRLPLYVFVDGHTWSAAEYFAVILQDNHAATIVGELTGGAGCGYTNGGIPTKLKNSGAEVKMPDCVRFRPNGSNEVSGITPDVLVPWASRDTPYQHVRKLEVVLERLPAEKTKAAH